MLQLSPSCNGSPAMLLKCPFPSLFYDPSSASRQEYMGSLNTHSLIGLTECLPARNSHLHWNGGSEQYYFSQKLFYNLHRKMLFVACKMVLALSPATEIPKKLLYVILWPNVSHLPWIQLPRQHVTPCFIKRHYASFSWWSRQRHLYSFLRPSSHLGPNILF